MVRAILYAEDAAADTKGQRFGKWIRLAARRFLRDLGRAHKPKSPPYYFDPKWANRVCRFIELLPHVEGDWGGDNRIKLEDSQVFLLVQLFGFRSLEGNRRFNTCLFAVARKNAKSTLAAAILIACYCLEQETGPQILTAATTGSQARIVWNIAKRMIEKSPELQEHYEVACFAHNVVRYPVGGSFRAINSKASTQDGLNPSALAFDELHAHKNHDLFNVLRSAAGARKNPLFLYTTTEGYENPGPWAEERSFAFKVLEGKVRADHFLAIYYALDEKDDDFDETKWGKANPLLGVSVSLDKLREYATEAKQKPGSLAEFRIKRLNRRASAAEGFINLWRWNRCSGEVPLEKLQGRKCVAALDLATTSDLAAWRLLWFVPEERTFYTWGRFWCPEAMVRERSNRGSQPYAPWVQAGWVEQTQGDTIDFAHIRGRILEDCQRFRPEKVAYDPWNAGQLVTELTNEGLPMLGFVQGIKSYTPGMNAMERAYVSGALRHGGNPVLTWMASNLVAFTDANLNKKPDRKKSADKIDGMACLAMCFALWEADDGASFGDFISNPVSA